jgi:3-deoxy-D-manno-octulosonate 8-phosphate phosphatase (KDO 8-P phosphatase)
MSLTTSQITELFKGAFLTPTPELQQRLSRIKAFVFDWDGVFNNGVKDEHASSPFSEVDAMGTNLLRFGYFLDNGRLPVTTILSGEQNKASFVLAKRERMHAVYYRVKAKAAALAHLVSEFGLQPFEVCFFFDDVLDLGFADKCGLRIMIGRESNPLLLNFVQRYKLADYITHAHGGNHGLREATELLMGLAGRYDRIIEHRMNYTDAYQRYLAARDETQTRFFTPSESKIIEQTPA